MMMESLIDQLQFEFFNEYTFSIGFLQFQWEIVPEVGPLYDEAFQAEAVSSYSRCVQVPSFSSPSVVDVDFRNPGEFYN